MTVLLNETKLLLLKLSIREDRVLFKRRFTRHIGITSYATTEEMYFTYVNMPSPNGKISFTVYSTTDKMYLNRSTSAL